MSDEKLGGEEYEKGVLDEPIDGEEDDDEEQIELRPRPSKFSIFLAATDEVGTNESSSPMIESDTSTEEGEEEEKDSQERKQLDRKMASGDPTKHWKRKKRAKRKKKDHTGQSSADADNLDELLRELERKEVPKDRPKAATLSVEDKPNTTSTRSALDCLLNIESRSLLDEEQQQPLSPMVGRRVPPPLGKIVHSRVNWPQPRQLGFHMIVDDVDEQRQVKWYRFWYKEAYQQQQEAFLLYQQQMDYQAIMTGILRHQNPYHLDSLLLMANLLQRQGDMQGAVTCIERGIFACEFVSHSSFEALSSSHRLDYAWRENRAFFLLLHCHLLSKLQVGQFRVALEFAKLLLAKEPDGDPLAMLLLIDSLSLRANCPNFLLDFYEHFSKSKRLDLMPNFRFSLPLALHRMGQEEEAEKYLEEALVRFPFVLSQILDHLQIQADPKVDRNYYLNSLASYRETEGMLLMVQIYLRHSAPIWRDPGTLNWLEMATHRVLPRLQTVRRAEMDEWARKRKSLFVGLPENIARHSVLHAISVPETLQQDAQLNLGDEPIIDPCPPKNGRQAYLTRNLTDSSEALIISRQGDPLAHRRRRSVYDQSDPIPTDTIQQENGPNVQNSQGFFVAFLRSLLPQWVQDLLISLFAERFQRLFTHNQ